MKTDDIKHEQPEIRPLTSDEMQQVAGGNAFGIPGLFGPYYTYGGNTSGVANAGYTYGQPTLYH